MASKLEIEIAKELAIGWQERATNEKYMADWSIRDNDLREAIYWQENAEYAYRLARMYLDQATVGE